MGAAATFFKCLIPRIALSLIFSWYGHLGFGGDPQAYHLLGKYLKSTLLDPVHANLDDVLNAEGFEELDPTYEIHAVAIDHIRQPESVRQYLNTVIPIAMLHAVAYCVWDYPLTFVLLNAVISAFAITRATSVFQMDDRQAAWLVFNPVSIYFAATHFKESLAESLVIAFTTTLYGRNRPVRALFWVLMMLLFRVSFAGILAAFFLFRYTPFGRLRPLYLFGGILIVLALLPPFFNLDEVKMGGSGAIYSLVYQNEYTMKLLGPLLGLLLPFPFHIVLAHWATDPGTIFTTVYGIYYYIVAIGWLIHWRYLSRCLETNRLVNTVIFVSLLLGYLFVGASGVKDRYFVAFFPVMILALIGMMALKKEQLSDPEPCEIGTAQPTACL